MSSNNFEIIHLDCCCSSVEHSLRFLCDPEDPNCVFYTEVVLRRGGFWWRLKNGVKYIFGRQSDYGHFDCFMMHTGEQMLLQNFLERAIARKFTKTPE